MALIKLVHEKHPLTADTSLHAFFDRLEDENAVLLESGADGRYSYIAYDPFLLVWSENKTVHTVQVRDFGRGSCAAGKGILDGKPDEALAELFEKYRFRGDAPVPFACGAAGFFSYDFGCGFVGVKQKVYDDTGLPDYRFNFYDKVIAVDNREKVYYLMAAAETDMAAKRKLEEIRRDLSGPARLRRSGTVGEAASNVSKAQYLENVEAIKELLSRGESYQVNYSQRFSAECSLDGWTVYKKLARVSPAPYACYMRFSDFTVVSSSPELLLSGRGQKLLTRPVKGTVKRGRNEREDERGITELLASKKDEAELSMIVDLARNDLGKVCETGSVQVESHREIGKYSHVIHTFSRVSGNIARGKRIMDAIAAVFPGGSITGCPKKRTMEIIDGFEDFKRGVYTGSAGFVSFNGDFDFNILIRTIMIKDGIAYFSAGGGIVMDSDPEKEYDESLMKARGIIESLRQ